jgi:hypothetical protein
MIQCIEDKANLMNDSAVCEKVNHLCQMAENGLGMASMTVPSIFRLDMSNIEALQLVCGSFGLALPGLTLQTRCLPNCVLMGPNAALDEETVRKSIMTSTHFLGCSCCGTYQRHNGLL